MGIKIKDPTLVYDFDYIIYAAGFAGEKRTIEVEHPEYDEVLKFANRTEMWGRGKKIGGWLEAENRQRETEGKEPLTKEDFHITDVQSAEPIANVLHTVKMMVEAPASLLGAKEIVGFLGGKDVPLWRWERSTLLEYKGNRKDAISPIYKQDIINYLKSKYGATEVNDGREADDAVIMEAIRQGNDRSIVVGVDKDIYTCPVNCYNPNRPEEGVVDCTGFGKLWLDDKGSVRGVGRQYKYFQITSQDAIDNYKASSHSDVKWGDKSAFKALVDSKSDKESWVIMRDVFQHLYPENKLIQTWRGNRVEINWLYVFQEMFDMAHMFRWDGDYVDVGDVLRRMGIEWTP